MFGMMLAMMAGTVLFLGLVIGGIVAAAMWAARELGGRRQASGLGALDILDERFARGEMNPEEYEERRQTLLRR